MAPKRMANTWSQTVPISYIFWQMIWDMETWGATIRNPRSEPLISISWQARACSLLMPMRQPLFARLRGMPF
ncbi:UNVERIFIED_CONTAM: hypothetical protein GTU68_009189 [Idotea baltica]|nr:hypothetical protein [Idotea baltica]